MGGTITGLASRPVFGSSVNLRRQAAQESAGRRDADDSWSRRASAMLALVMAVGFAAITLEGVSGGPMISRESSAAVGSIVDSMALGIAILTFGALGAKNRFAPDRINIATGCILGVLAILVLPIDVVLSDLSTVETTALVVGTRVTILALAITTARQSRGDENTFLYRTVLVVLSGALLVSVVAAAGLRAVDVSHDEIFRWVLAGTALALLLCAVWIGASSIRASERRGQVLAFAFIAIAVADGRQAVMDEGTLGLTSGKIMRLVVIGAILIFTVRELRDLALRERDLARAAHNESERAADRLVAQLSFQERFVHDTRNALLAIQGGVHSLSDGQNEAMVRAVTSEVDRLRQLLEAEGSDPLPQSFDLVEALQPMVLCYAAAGKDIRLKADGAVIARGRPSIAAEVAQNLIENALVHGEDGGVSVWMFARQSHVEVRVADRGCGVEADVRESIFAHGTAGGDSSGVGLHISRRLIENQGGSLTVSDRHGGGSIFTFTLPSGDKVTP